MRWVLFLVVVGKLSAQGCGISVTTSAGQPPFYDGTNGSTPVAAGGGTFTVDVNSPANCPPWTASLSTSTPWLTINQTTVQGPTGSFSFTVANNTTNSQRGPAIISLTGNFSTYQIPVAQAAATCTLTLPSTSAGAVFGGGPSSFAVQTGCDWNAYSNVSWITVPSSSSTGSGIGSVSYTVAPNSCVGARTAGTITVGAGSTSRLNSNNPTATFTVNQAGSATNLSISPLSTSLAAAGGQGRVVITTGVGCPWTYYADSTWIQIINNGGGSGPSGISYNIPQNTGPARTGHIIIVDNNSTFTISQAGATAPVPVLSAVVNAASGASGPLAPGEVVAVFGTGLGPASGVAAQLPSGAASFPTTLSGVQVFFDKYPAIPYFVSATQINAIAPYEIAGQSTTQITVSYGGTSAPLQAQVQPASPAILTLDYTGYGQGAILNQDYSVNGKFSAAARGSAIMIYLVGAGATSPSSADGSVTPGVNTLALQPVTVTIGGIQTQAIYAGGAPGAVAGLTQINAVVPANVTPGPNVPVSIQIGSFQTQAGVTMVVN